LIELKVHRFFFPVFWSGENPSADLPKETSGNDAENNPATFVLCPEKMDSDQNGDDKGNEISLDEHLV